MKLSEPPVRTTYVPVSDGPEDRSLSFYSQASCISSVTWLSCSLRSLLSRIYSPGITQGYSADCCGQASLLRT